jgi:hypothetical protein
VIVVLGVFLRVFSVDAQYRREKTLFFEDSYRNARYTGNVVRTGFPGRVDRYHDLGADDTIVPRGGINISADVGMCYFDAAMFRILGVLCPYFSMETYVYVAPVFHSSILLLVVFFSVGSAWGGGAGLLSAAMVAVSPVLSIKGALGMYDKDVLSCVSVVCLWVSAFFLERGGVMRLVCWVVAVLFTAALSRYWVVFVPLTMALGVARLRMFPKNIVRWTAVSVPVVLFCMMVVSQGVWSRFVSVVLQHWNVIDGVLPDMLSGVGELSSPGLQVLVQESGALLLALVAAELFVSLRGGDVFRVFTASTATVFFVLSAVTFRFVLWYALFAALAAGRLLADVYTRKRMAGALITGFTVFVLILTAYAGVHRLKPLFDVSATRAVGYLQNEASNGSLVVSRWDAGSYITAKTGLTVVADSSTQQTYFNFLTYRMFFENDPAVVQRMLSFVANVDATIFYYDLLQAFPDEMQRYFVMDMIFRLERAEAEQYLSRTSLPVNTRQRLLAVVHDGPQRDVYWYVDAQTFSTFGLVRAAGGWNFFEKAAWQLRHDEQSDRVRRLATFSFSTEKEVMTVLQADVPCAKESVKSYSACATKRNAVLGTDTLGYFLIRGIGSFESLFERVYADRSGNVAVYRYRGKEGRR